MHSALSNGYGVEDIHVLKVWIFSQELLELRTGGVGHGAVSVVLLEVLPARDQLAAITAFPFLVSFWGNLVDGLGNCLILLLLVRI